MGARPSHSPCRSGVTVLMLLVLGLAFVAPLVPQQTVRAAATEVVTNTGDAGPGTLRQAIADVATGGEITFAIPGDGPHTIDLEGELFIGKDLTITGPGADLLTVRRSGTALVDFGIFFINGVTTTISGLTISGGQNRSSGGGIAASSGSTLTIANSTISGNTAAGVGGGIFADGFVTLTATIVANSPNGGNCFLEVDPRNAISSLGYNLSSDDTCFSAGGADLINTDPMLGPLADNGGPTQTHALLDGSEAIDPIPEANCPAVVDQRGVERPQGAGCDIGAVEVAPAPILSLPDEPIVAEATGPTGAAVTFTVSAFDRAGQPLAVTCEAASEVVISGDTFPLGNITVECYATDSLHQTTDGDFTITVPADFAVYTTDPDGLVVDFAAEVSASDTVDPDPAIVCVPASGSQFAIGPHEVECTATDDSANDATDTFTITVIDTLQLLSDLAQDVRALDLPFRDEFGLVVLIGVAGDLAGDGHVAASCDFLELFSTRVASLVPETIGQDAAEQLIDDARGVQAALGCAPQR